MLPRRVNKWNRCSFRRSLGVVASINWTVNQYPCFVCDISRGVNLNGTAA